MIARSGMTSVDDRIAEAMQEIRRVHAIGTALLARVGPAGSGGSIAAEAEACGLSYDDACRYRQFADPDRGFAADEIDELERLCRDHDHVPGTAMLDVLIKVQDIGLRRELMQDSVTQHWSMATLATEIRKRQPRQRCSGGGRQPRVESDVPGLLRQIEEHCIRWTRWAAAATNAATIRSLPVDVLERYGPAVDAMTALLGVVQSHDASLAGSTAKPQPLRDASPGTRGEARRSRV